MFDFSAFFDHFDEILQGFWATIRLAAASAVLSLIIGTVLASFRVSPVPVLRSFGAGYVNIVRNTPLTLVLLLCAQGLNDTLHLTFSSNSSTTYYWWAVLGLSGYTGAFVCETLRSGINTVPLGQAEAARSIGLTFIQSLRMIILPQAFRNVIPALMNTVVSLQKDVALVSVLGVREAVREAQIYTSRTFNYTSYLAATVLFLAVSIPLVRVVDHLTVRDRRRRMQVAS